MASKSRLKTDPTYPNVGTVAGSPLDAQVSKRSGERDLRHRLAISLINTLVDPGMRVASHANLLVAEEKLETGDLFK